MGVIADMGLMQYAGKGHYVGDIPPEPPAPTPKKEEIPKKVIEAKPKTRPQNIEEMIAASGIRRSGGQKAGPPRQRYPNKPRKGEKY